MGIEAVCHAAPTAPPGAPAVSCIPCTPWSNWARRVAGDAEGVAPTMVGGVPRMVRRRLLLTMVRAGVGLRLAW